MKSSQTGSSIGVVEDGSASVVFREGAGARGWRLDVVVEDRVSGHIDDGNGVYRYFEGPQNDIIWSFAERDLGRLKARIRTTIVAEGRSRPAPSV
jgi:hypothetical protein